MSNISVDTLVEEYQVLKEYIPQKDRQEAADALMSILIDMLDDKEAKEFSAADKNLSKAYAEYSYEEDEDDGYYDE